MRINRRALSLAVVGLGLSLTLPALAAGETDQNTAGTSAGMTESQGAEGTQTTTHKHRTHHASRHHRRSHRTAMRSGGMSNAGGAESGSSGTNAGGGMSNSGSK
jgi:hypothetical protein